MNNNTDTLVAFAATTRATRFWTGTDATGNLARFWTKEPRAADFPALTIKSHLIVPVYGAGDEIPAATAPQYVPAELLRIGELLRTQDNRFTEAPMFAVEQKKPVVSDADYNDCRVEWRESENGDYELASPERAARLEALYQSGRDTEGWTRYEMTDVWEFVTACFTEQGCRDYLARNGHNLRETRIYAYGSFRNREYRAVRNWLMSLPAPTTVNEGAAQ